MDARVALALGLLGACVLWVATGPAAAQDADHHSDPGVQINPVGAANPAANPAGAPSKDPAGNAVPTDGGSEGGDMSYGVAAVLGILGVYMRSIKSAANDGPK